MTFAHTNPHLNLKKTADNTTRDNSAISVPSCDMNRKLDNLKWQCHNMNICYILCEPPALTFLKMQLTKLLNLLDSALILKSFSQ
jgi:hypothetical protein